MLHLMLSALALCCWRPAGGGRGRNVHAGAGVWGARYSKPEVPLPHLPWARLYDVQGPEVPRVSAQLCMDKPRALFSDTAVHIRLCSGLAETRRVSLGNGATLISDKCHLFDMEIIRNRQYRLTTPKTSLNARNI